MPLLPMPHVFHDGTSEVASGAQVDEDLEAIVKNVLQHGLSEEVQAKWGKATFAGGSSELTVTHGLGRTPKLVLLTPNQGAGTTAVFLNVKNGSEGATTFVAQANVSQGTAQPFYWLVIG